MDIRTLGRFVNIGAKDERNVLICKYFQLIDQVRVRKARIAPIRYYRDKFAQPFLS